MIEIKDLLSRFNNLLLSEELKINAVKNSLNKLVGIDIKPKEIEIKNNVVYLNIKPIYKNEIFIKKDKIILDLSKSLGVKTPENIR